MDKTQSYLRKLLVYSTSRLPYSTALLTHIPHCSHPTSSVEPPCFSPSSSFFCEYTNFPPMGPYFDGVEIARALRQEANEELDFRCWWSYTPTHLPDTWIPPSWLLSGYSLLTLSWYPKTQFIHVQPWMLYQPFMLLYDQLTHQSNLKNYIQVAENIQPSCRCAHQ